MIKTLLIANRGEIACRIIQTAKKLHIRTVAIYSEIDEQALHVQWADESFCIGPAPALASYLNGDKIIEIAKIARADAIHPGYGFLSEDAHFAEQCLQAGLIFVGPPPSAIRTMGDKNLAKTTMVAAGVPVVPGYHGDKIDLASLKTAAERIGFPLLIKASAGGGGKGMRLVENPEQLADALQSAMREAKASFGDSRVFLEKYLAQARHIEVQILFDQQGHGIYLFDRDCSIQRRHQKVIEEAPAGGLSPSTREKMAQTALRAGAAIQYCSTGTIEFLVDEHENFYFMEMNTRLQVEHPVTEMITGLDLVAWQLRIAAGEPLTLEASDIKTTGHAIEARLYAENPQNNFMPSSGILRYLRFPTPQSQMRIDSGFQAHDYMSVYYDPLLAKLIAWGKDRSEAIVVLREMLNETAVAGVHTNWALLQRIINNPLFIQGKITTGFIPAQQTQLLHTPESIPHQVIALACLAWVRNQELEQQQWLLDTPEPSPWQQGDSWRLNHPAARNISFWQNGKNWRVAIAMEGDHFKCCALEGTWLWLDTHHLVIHIDGKEISAIIFSENDQLTLFCNGEQWEFYLLNPAAAVDTLSQKTGLQAPMPGTVIEICVKPGQTVQTGDRLLVIEAMKMEHALLAPHSGSIQEIFYQAGERVNEGDPLLSFTEC